MLGELDLGNPEIEPTTVVADRIRNGLKHVAPDRLVVAPDCGMRITIAFLAEASSMDHII
jgi:5-methyltetrahydropteroyltriglutamate--homocysteine methyltransferase